MASPIPHRAAGLVEIDATNPVPVLTTSSGTNSVALAVTVPESTMISTALNPTSSEDKSAVTLIQPDLISTSPAARLGIGEAMLLSYEPLRVESVEIGGVQSEGLDCSGRMMLRSATRKIRLL